MKLKAFIVFIVCSSFSMAWAEEDLLTEKTIETLESAIQYLAKHQNQDGYWNAEYSTAISAFAGLAFLSMGYQPSSGPYGDELEKLILGFVRFQKENGLLSLENDDRRMYGHGYATLFLSQAYGQSYDRELNEAIHQALHKAVNLIVRSQTQEGGWGYNPSDDFHEGSVTIVQLQALRAARDAGIKVPIETIERAIQFVKNSQYADGSISYQIKYGKPDGASSLALTSAGMSVLYNAGDYTFDKTKEKGFQYLDLQFDHLIHTDNFPFYTHFYAFQIYKHRGAYYDDVFKHILAGLAHRFLPYANIYSLYAEVNLAPGYEKKFRAFRTYYRAIEQKLETDKKSSSGSTYWTGEAGDIYGTAIAILILSSPLELLPIFSD
ncbi:MAG: terpene cyclase/mutase family protein [Deltaproteobacteria bacterium]|nr:terpene cyclase/mutase family protein [Deltaproteobacteria bacterium]